MKRKVTTADATVTQALEEALKRFASNHHGKNASYIPYLASVPSQLFGISIMFCDGTHAEVGDTDYEFAIESISKVFTLAHVLDEYSPQTLRSKIGCDPTGEPFNSVVALELHKGRPLNPFVNAGAMATVSALGENPGHLQRLCRARVKRQRRGVQVRSRQQSAQSRHCLVAAKLWLHVRRPDGSLRRVYPPMFGVDHLPGPGHDGRDPGQWRG